MADHDPAYIAARELDGTLQKLRQDLCECKTKVDAAGKAKNANPLNWVTAVLFAFFLFWLLSFCGK